MQRSKGTLHSNNYDGARMSSELMGARIKLSKALADWRGFDMALKFVPKKYVNIRKLMEKELRRAEKRKNEALEVLTK